MKKILLFLLLAVPAQAQIVYEAPDSRTAGDFFVPGNTYFGGTQVAPKGFFYATSGTFTLAGGIFTIGAAYNTPDVGLGRVGAGIFKITSGDNATSIRGLLGGGAAVASATALPVPTGNVFHVTGTTTITSITSTNFESGACVTMIFDGILTLTAGNNLKMAGNFVTTANDTISLCYDGTNWYETARVVVTN
jgi:hypothetical protein